jgi:enoyl-CoA hydratase/carnithine racemase
MRFAARESAIFGQFEPSLGVIPGGGAAQHLTRLMGRADYAADLAERYGWINRALPADALDDFVSSLARRIASFPAAGRAVVKEASQGDCARSHRGSSAAIPTRSARESVAARPRGRSAPR